MTEDLGDKESHGSTGEELGGAVAAREGREVLTLEMASLLSRVRNALRYGSPMRRRARRLVRGGKEQIVAFIVILTLLRYGYKYTARGYRLDSELGDLLTYGHRLLAIPITVISRLNHLLPVPLGSLAFPLVVFTIWGAWNVWRLRAKRNAESARLRRAQTSSASTAAAEPGTYEPALTLSRRDLLRAGTSVGACAVVGWPIFLAPERLRVAEWAIPIKDLPEAFDGLRIVHITDTHIGPLVPPSTIRRAVEMAMETQPDVALLTGDYVTQGDGAEKVARLLEPLAGLPYGALGVMGNHDNWEGPEETREPLRRHGIVLIDNDHRMLLRPGTDGTVARLCVCGVGDAWTDLVRPRLATLGVPEDTPRILLSHNPDVAEGSEWDPQNGVPRIDLQLSGHTHGGQVVVPWKGALVVPSEFGRKYASGLARGRWWPVITSRGVGLSGAPVRVNCPPEVGLITLRRA